MLVNQFEVIWRLTIVHTGWPWQFGHRMETTNQLNAIAPVTAQARASRGFRSTNSRSLKLKRAATAVHAATANAAWNTHNFHRWPVAANQSGDAGPRSFIGNSDPPSPLRGLEVRAHNVRRRRRLETRPGTVI